MNDKIIRITKKLPRPKMRVYKPYNLWTIIKKTIKKTPSK